MDPSVADRAVLLQAVDAPPAGRPGQGTRADLHGEVLLGEPAELQFQRVDPPGGTGVRVRPGDALDEFGGPVDQQGRGQVVEGVVEEEGVLFDRPQAGGPGHRGVAAAVAGALVRGCL